MEIITVLVAPSSLSFCEAKYIFCLFHSSNDINNNETTTKELEVGYLNFTLGAPHTFYSLQGNSILSNEIFPEKNTFLICRLRLTISPVKKLKIL